MNILVLDVGTTSMRGILYDEDSRVLAVSQYKNHPVFHNGIYVTEDPADWSQNTFHIMRDIVDQCGCSAVDAVAITSQRSSVIPVDREGSPLMDTIMWQDTRNARICDRLKQYNELSFRKTGAHINTVFSGSKMTWLKEQASEIYEKAYKLPVIPEYILYLLCGTYRTDSTYGSRSGLMNLKERAWDPEMLEIYGIDADRLLEICEPGTVIGYVTEACSALTGCRAGIPVISSGGDQQCGALGQGAVSDGSVSIVTGTGGFLLAQSDTVPENLKDDVICNCAALPGKYIIEANVLACSAVYDWCARELLGMRDKIDYELVEKILEEADPEKDCLVIPYFKGRGVPDYNTRATASFLQVSLATTRGEMIRSAVEGIFMELKNHLTTFESYLDIHDLHVSGGLTASRLLNQMQADIYGRPVRIMDDKESTALGAFLVASLTLGIFASEKDAFRKIRESRSEKMWTPDPARTAWYAAKRQKMNAAYQILKEGQIS